MSPVHEIAAALNALTDDELGKLENMIRERRVNTPRKALAQEGRFRAVFEASVDAMMITSPDGRIYAANAAACRLLDLSEEEICRAGRSGIVDVSDPRLQAGLEERARTGRFHGELIFRRRDGSRFPAEISSTVFRDVDGSDATIIILRDVTERRRAEKALRESEERFKLTFDQSPIGSAIVSLNYRFLRVNDVLCRLTGYTEMELTQLTFPQITHPDDLAVDLKFTGQLEAGEIEHYTIEKRYLHKSGRVIWGQMSRRILRNHDGEPLYFLALIEDITRRKEAEGERERLVGELKLALAQVKTLTGMLPICSSCKKVRNDEGYWSQIETYIMQHSDATFTHGICPDCTRKYFPQLDQ
jgi:PAS domain S-box-containing protein